MIHINIDSHRKTLSALQELKEKMLSEREHQLAIVESMEKGWEGLTARTFCTMQRQMLENGLYETTYQQTKGMCSIMEEALPRMGRLKRQCDTLPACLQGGVPSAAGYASGSLMLDEGKVPAIDAACDSILNANVQLEASLNQIMEACQGLVDFGDCPSRLYDAARKVERIGILKDEIDSYARGVRDLDADLRISYAAYKDEMILETIEEQARIEAEKKMDALLEELDSKGLTIEQYRSALLDTFMYLDFFDDDNRDYEYVSKKVNNAKTLGEMLDILRDYETYTKEDEEEKSTRYIYYQILSDAIAKDPALARFEIQSMSRAMEEKGYNEGINGITFVDPSTNTVYVSFRGTSMGEWGDDGRRFNCKDMDSLTPQMEQTLDYFNTVGKMMGWNENTRLIVTGHSQGGNDAQVVTLLSDYGHFVDQCYSFDGEGHSPELMREAEAYMNAKFGTGEYEARLSRMYSICGEYDFVNHLGEKVIPEENTIYIRCAIDGFARCHDIVSMFAVKEGDEYHYSGTINIGTGTGPSFLTHFTATVWDEVYEMPDSMRASCQEALMNIMEMVLSSGECTEGLNGEKATFTDYLILCGYGMDAIAESGMETVTENYLKKALKEYAAEGICDMALKYGWVNDRESQYIQNIMGDAIDDVADTLETIRDMEDTLDYTGYEVLKYDLAADWKLPADILEGIGKVLNGDMDYESGFLYLQAEHLVDYVAGKGKRELNTLRNTAGIAAEEVKKDIRHKVNTFNAAVSVIQGVGEYMQEHVEKFENAWRAVKETYTVKEETPESWWDSRVTKFMDSWCGDILTAAAGGTAIMANPLFPLLVEGKTVYDIKKRNMTPGESAEETGEFFKGYVESLPKQLDNITGGLLELPNTIMMLPDTVPAGIIDAAEYLNQKGIKGTASDIWNTVRNQFQTKVRDFVTADAREKGNMTGNTAIAAADAALATAGVIKVTKSGKIFGSLDTFDDTLHTVKRAENVMDDALDSTKTAKKIENAVENVADEAADAKKLEKAGEIETELENSIKTVNGFDIEVNVGQQNKHIPGTNEYKNALNNGQIKSIMYGDANDIQKLLNDKAGTGDFLGTNKERVNFEQVIGQYVDPNTGVGVETTIGIIHYGKRGAHIVPARPN